MRPARRKMAATGGRLEFWMLGDLELGTGRPGGDVNGLDTHRPTLTSPGRSAIILALLVKLQSCGANWIPCRDSAAGVSPVWTWVALYLCDRCVQGAAGPTGEG